MTPDTEDFRASLDRPTRVLTALASLFLLALALGLPLLAWAVPGERAVAPRLVALAQAPLVLGLLALCWALSPRGYRLDAHGLTVLRRLARGVHVPWAQLEAVEPLRPEHFTGVSRTFGVGGLFGYYGRFHSRGLGAFRLYATRQRPTVLVRTARGALVLTPDEPERFLARAQAHAAR